LNALQRALKLTALCELAHCHVGDAMFLPFTFLVLGGGGLLHRSHTAALQVISMINCLVYWNNFVLNNAMKIEKNDH
jgi:hypothetical protein